MKNIIDEQRSFAYSWVDTYYVMPNLLKYSRPDRLSLKCVKRNKVALLEDNKIHFYGSRQKFEN